MPNETGRLEAEGEAARGRLRRTGEQREQLQRELADVEQELERDIVAAEAAGVPKLAIAREARVSRQHVYNVLERGAAAS